MTLQQLYDHAENDQLLDLLFLNEIQMLQPGQEAELALLIRQPEAEAVLIMFHLEKDTLEYPEETVVEESWVVPASTPRRIPWRRLAAVAAGLAAVAGVYLFYARQHHTAVTGATALTATPAVPGKKQDVLPGKNRAVLILANGDKVVLDDADKGAVAAQGNTTVIKLGNGQLAYQAGKEQTSVNAYNTLTTPRAGKYMVQLPDGSHVYLNAASSLRFPVAFTGKQRLVELLAGEAYFEIAKNATQPFVVKTGQHTVQVLGTNFNISAYPDDNMVSTTLLQGLVRVTSGDVIQQLVPGQQAQATDKGIQLVAHPDMADVMAWKEGVFRFNESTVQDIMKQLARWYDIKVVYATDKPSEHFVGTIQRNVPLSQVLHLLELTGSLQFSIEGNTVVVR